MKGMENKNIELIIISLIISFHPFCKSNSSKEINIGIMNHRPSLYFQTAPIEQKEDFIILNTLRSSYLEIIKSKLKSKYPNSIIKIKNFTNP